MVIGAVYLLSVVATLFASSTLHLPHLDPLVRAIKEAIRKLCAARRSEDSNAKVFELGSRRARHRNFSVYATSLAALLVIGVTPAHAANYWWVGSSGGNTSDSANWASANPASCTGGGAGVPGASDTITFDADCDNNATIDSNLSVLSFTTSAG